MSDEQKTRVTVTIYGQKYTLVGTASKEHVQQVAKYVHQKMEEISSKTPQLDTSRISVLTAINVADEYFRLKEEYDHLLRILEEYTER